MRDENSFPNRILLGQLISNGDCLYATAVARQIKQDFPGCHLTWAVSSLCRATLEENPFIDQIWEIPLADWSDESLRMSWSSFEEQALKQYEQGFYDFVFFTQIYPGNSHHFEGTVRPGIFLGYPGKITVPLQPSLVLRTEEVEKVSNFAERHRLLDYEQVVLFEFSAKSGQSHVTREFALQAAEKITKKSAGRHAVILSSHQGLPGLGEGIIDASALTLREMAELSKYCSLLVGCSSGISTITTSTWAKSLPMIQMLTNRCAMFASLVHDYLYFGLPTSHVLEMFDADVARLVSCFDSFLNKGWPQTRDLYHESPRIAFTYYLDFARSVLLEDHDYYGFCVSLRHTVDRYGWHPDLEEALGQIAQKILPESIMNGAASADELLSRLSGPARLLSSIAVGRPGHSPASIRPATCLLSFRRNRQELEQILEATSRLGKYEPEFCELITALLDSSPKEKVAILQSKHPGRESPRIARVLALIQQAEYTEARQELAQWKRIARPWTSQLEEILGDLDWMHGYHAEALASYQAALGNSPRHSVLQRKIDRLVARNSGNPASTKPNAGLDHLGIDAPVYSLKNFVKSRPIGVRMPFISHAQNYEDVMLWRALRDVERGFYVDVGAADPEADSVTRAFYEHGWSGINLEPENEFFNRLSQARLRDTNLKVAAGREARVGILQAIPGTGLSSLDPLIALRHQASGWHTHEIVVPVLPLTKVLEDHAPPVIHFLNIDVEGAESEVLEGLDLNRVRPWIIVIEANEPNSTVTSRDKWEHLIVNRGYGLAYFDGLNCFYVADEMAGLKERLAVPPNVFDDFVHWTEWSTRQKAVTLEQDLVGLKRREISLEGALQEERAQITNLRSALQETADLRDALQAERARVGQLLGSIYQLEKQLSVPSIDRAVGRVFRRLRETGDRLTGGGLRSLAKRVLTALLRGAVRKPGLLAFGRVLLKPFPRLMARLYGLATAADGAAVQSIPQQVAVASAIGSQGGSESAGSHVKPPT